MTLKLIFHMIWVCLIVSGNTPSETFIQYQHASNRLESNGSQYNRDSILVWQKVGIESFAGGMGTESDPWLIETAEHLNNIRLYNGLASGGKHFRQIADIDLDVEPFNQGQGWVPLGGSHGFRGIYDGDGYIISGLYINWPNGWEVGLFGSVCWGGTIKNLGVIDVDISSRLYVGALVGKLDRGHVNNCFSSGNIYATQSEVGGLVGKSFFSSTIKNSRSSCNVSGTARHLGGLVGSITHSTLILNCHSEGEVVGFPDLGFGGWWAGGLVGKNQYSSMIINSSSSSNVTAQAIVGGLVGQQWLSESHGSHASGNVTGEKHQVGGFVGFHRTATITNSSSTGNVSGNYEVGGFVGKNLTANIENSFSLGNVESILGDCGGFAGSNHFESDIINCFSKGHATGKRAIGGFLGFNRGGTVTNSFSDSHVEGELYSGGFVGEIIGGQMKSCYSRGEVTGDRGIGGFVGHIYGSANAVNDCYSVSKVSGNLYIGGLVGYNYGGIISRSYSVGLVEGNEFAGGLIGLNQGGIVHNSYWDTVTSGMNNSQGGIGLNTQDLLEMATFMNWNFEDTWQMIEYESYPFLRWQEYPGSFNFPFSKLILNVAPQDAGIIMGEGSYYPNEQVFVSASSNEGYEFIMWTNHIGEVVSRNPGFYLVMPDSNLMLTSHFCDGTKYFLGKKVNIEEAGLVQVDPMDDYYQVGERIKFLASSFPGYKFLGWFNKDSIQISHKKEIIFVMPAHDTDITAMFEAIKYNLKATALPRRFGEVSYYPENKYFKVGDHIWLSASPYPGYKFVNWTDEANISVNDDENFLFIMPPSNVTLKANMINIDYQVSVLLNPAEAGTVLIDPLKDYYHIGNRITFIAVPFSNYEFLDWRDSTDSILTTSNFYQVIVDTSDIYLYANFRLKSNIDDLSGPDIRVFPNPASDKIFIDSEATLEWVNLFNGNGQIVFSLQANSNHTWINTTSYSSGIYVLEIKTKYGLLRKRIQITH